MHSGERYGSKLIAGEETHAVAALLADGQKVVAVNLQTVSRNEHQHVSRNTTGESQYLLVLNTDKQELARKDYKR